MRFFKVILLVLFLSNWTVLTAQSEEKKKPDYGWEQQSTFTLNFTQTTFDNWVQGGENSWAWIAEAPFMFNLRKPGFTWANQGKLAFGKSKVGDQSARKASDLIRFESVYTHNLGVFVNPYVSISGQTQFAKGYNYGDTTRAEISGFMDPGYFTQSAGVGYEPNRFVKLRLGAAVKETFARNHPVPYTDDPETEELETSKVEFGADFVADGRINLHDNLIFTSKVVLFSTLESLNTVDVDWDNNFTATVTSHLQVNFNVQIYYDRDISKKRQLKQLLSVGFSYTLI